MILQVKRKSDNKIFDVFKYLKSNREDDQREHVWCEDWKGHHILNVDCEWCKCDDNQHSDIDKQQLRQPDVSSRREQLIAFLMDVDEVYGMHVKADAEKCVDDYLKSN